MVTPCSVPIPMPLGLFAQGHFFLGRPFGYSLHLGEARGGSVHAGMR
jgi:hypothetical protein